LNLNKKFLVEQSFVLPMALKVLNKDRELFKSFEMGNVFMDKLDSVIENIQRDLNTIKRKLYSELHIDVKIISKNK